MAGTDDRFEPAQKQLDSCTLEDDIELKGRTIISFAHMNIELHCSINLDRYDGGSSQREMMGIRWNSAADTDSQQVVPSAGFG